jgi:hypothetical protein
MLRLIAFLLFIKQPRLFDELDGNEGTKDEGTKDEGTKKRKDKGK